MKKHLDIPKKKSFNSLIETGNSRVSPTSPLLKSNKRPHSNKSVIFAEKSFLMDVEAIKEVNEDIRASAKNSNKELSDYSQIENESYGYHAEEEEDSLFDCQELESIINKQTADTSHEKAEGDPSSSSDSEASVKMKILLNRKKEQQEEEEKDKKASHKHSSIKQKRANQEDKKGR